MANIDKVSVKNTVYNIVSPAVVSDYIEVIGGACTKPDGYVEDEVILAKQNDVQLLFKATQDIAFGANIVENTNCVRTTLEEVLKNAGGGGGASSADQVSYDNSDSGLEAENVQEAVDELATNAGTASSQIQTLETNIQALTNNTYNVNDTAITEVASDDLLPIYDTSASGKKKIAVSNFIGGLVSNPNLLDNPWFTVNQRGSTSYTLAQNKYGFDRWCANSGGEIISKSDDTITLNGSTTNQYSGLTQRVERDRLKVGETYTLSILFSDGEVESRTFTLTSSGTNFLGSWNHAPKFNAVITSSSSNTLWGILPFDALANLDATVSFKAIKMEKGSVSTLAMDTAPNYMEELAKCQRYFVRYSAKDYHGTYAALAMGWVDRTDNTKAMVLLPTPVPMRRVAAMTYSGSLKILPGEIAISSIVSDGTDSIVNKALLVTMGTALTANQPISLWIRNDASAFIDLSADL